MSLFLFQRGQTPAARSPPRKRRVYMSTPNAFIHSALHMVVALLLTSIAGAVAYTVMDSATHFIL
jgi:hypothetical protein